MNLRVICLKAGTEVRRRKGERGERERVGGGEGERERVGGREGGRER